MPILKGTAYWTAIANPATGGKFPSGKYEITLGNLDANSIKIVKDLGMAKYLKTSDELPAQGTYLKIKGGRDKQGNAVRPRLIDVDKVDYPTNTLVGNGSQVKVQVGTYNTDNGTFWDLKTIMVEELVEYGFAVGDDEFDEDAGESYDPFAVED